MVGKQNNLSQTCPQGSLIQAVPQYQLPSQVTLGYVMLMVKAN